MSALNDISKAVAEAWNAIYSSIEWERRIVGKQLAKRAILHHLYENRVSVTQIYWSQWTPCCSKILSIIQLITTYELKMFSQKMSSWEEKNQQKRIALALLLKTQTPHFIAVKRHINLFKDHLHLRRPRRRKNLHLSKSTSSKAHNKTQLMVEPLTLIVEMLHLTSKKFQELKILGGDSYAVYFRAEGYNLIGHIWYHLWPGEDSTDCTLRATFNSTKSNVFPCKI